MDDTPENEHDIGKCPCSIGNTSSWWIRDFPSPQQKKVWEKCPDRIQQLGKNKNGPFELRTLEYYCIIKKYVAQMSTYWLITTPSTNLPFGIGKPSILLSVLIFPGDFGAHLEDQSSMKTPLFKLQGTRSTKPRCAKCLLVEKLFVENHVSKKATRWFKVTFSSPSWRSLNHLKGSLNHPKKVAKNCQEHRYILGLALASYSLAKCDCDFDGPQSHYDVSQFRWNFSPNPMQVVNPESLR